MGGQSTKEERRREHFKKEVKKSCPFSKSCDRSARSREQKYRGELRVRVLGEDRMTLVGKKKRSSRRGGRGMSPKTGEWVLQVKILSSFSQRSLKD